MLRSNRLETHPRTHRPVVSRLVADAPHTSTTVPKPTVSREATATPSRRTACCLSVASSACPQGACSANDADELELAGRRPVEEPDGLLVAVDAGGGDVVAVRAG